MQKKDRKLSIIKITHPFCLNFDKLVFFNLVELVKLLLIKQKYLFYMEMELGRKLLGSVNKFYKR